MKLADTYDDLRRELTHLRAQNPVVIEIDVRERDIRLDGLIRADAPQPRFPGVILSFRAAKLGPMQFACDDCKHWEDNLRAIALTLERLRLADLYGVTKRGEQYTGWKQLPDQSHLTPAMTVDEAARLIASLAGAVANDILIGNDAYRASYRQAAGKLHPDRGGDVVAWNQLQEAKRVLDAHHQGAVVP